MIAKSDQIILGVATAALMLGVLRWHSNTQSVQSVTIPASVRLQAPAASGDSQFDGFVQLGSVARPEGAAANGSGGQPAGTQAVQASSPALQQDPADNADFGIHTVSSGEYLGLLADRYNTSVNRLQVLNDIDGTTIQVGQELRYPRQER